MKSIRLIFNIIFVGIALFNNLSAGPVYAAKWTRGEQTVLLYGDKHNTHETNIWLERRATKAFCKELDATDEEILVLCEGYQSRPFNVVISEEDLKILSPLWSELFMFATGNFAHSKNNEPDSFVEAQNIDPRGELLFLVSDVIRFFRSKEAMQDQEQLRIYEKNFKAIQDGNLSGVFELLITNVKIFSEFAPDLLTKEIFDKIAKTLRERKTLLWKKIATDAGFTFEELNQITIKTIVQRMRSGTRYAKLADIIADFDLMRTFSNDALDAEALWQIAGVQNPCKKIALIAGYFHILNVEKYMTTLGFERCEFVGQSYVVAFEEAIRSGQYLENVVDAEHQTRVSPLLPCDTFGQLLFKNDIESAWQKIDDLPDSSLSSELIQAFDDRDAAVEEVERREPVSLVPFRTFTWINEKEQKKEELKRELRSNQSSPRKKVKRY